ncbi:uncharacterized protein AAEQ78_011628 [Lycaon pictus]
MKIEEMYFWWWRSLRCEQSWKEPEAAEDTRDEVEILCRGKNSASRLSSDSRHQLIAGVASPPTGFGICQAPQRQKWLGISAVWPILSKQDDQQMVIIQTEEEKSRMTKGPAEGSILLDQEQPELTCFGEKRRGSLLPLHASQIYGSCQQLSDGPGCVHSGLLLLEKHYPSAEGEGGVSQKLIVLFA